ncbi:MAG: RNA polymerase sigma factor [Ruminococcus sp.]|uniref:RNA polymerase sigma factor n=1 Tax=Ruminococcus sp. TaxID=41978 RepID=UPI0026149212|nr:RNA polymerase sigma factor [Ruminococcus sp.]MDD6709771.1 RNA polymerase sigma factor [Ruminococcus sp.]MEE3439986.1 RNA polymerase sigma factor [Ruminococcus sp.]
MSKKKFKYTKEFLEKVKNGDNDATTLLYEDAKDIAYNKAYSILNNHHDAEDIAEDSVLRAIEKIDTIKKPSEFPAWIRRVAENKAKDYIKKDKPTYMGEDFEYTTNDLNSNQKVLPEKMADSQENIDLYKKLISKLTDDQRNALVLNRIEGYKTREIAEMLGCSENTIKSRIHQGEKKLVKEAENLKKKGYTLNGMMPLDFFTVMSKSLGVTSTNVVSVVGATVLKSLSMKIVASVVAVVIVVSGVVGVSYLYTKSDVTQQGNVTDVQMYQPINKDETNYIKTLLAYTINNLSNDYSKISDSNMVDILSLYYRVKDSLPDARELFSSVKQADGNSYGVKIAQKDFQKVAKEVFGKELSNNAQSSTTELKNDYYYILPPADGSTWTFDINYIRYNSNKSKVTVIYVYTSGMNGVNPTEYTATFTRNENNKNFPFRIVSQNKDREIKTTTNTTEPSTYTYEESKRISSSSNVKYDGKVVDFGEYTLKVPNSWAYEKNATYGILFYEPKTKSKNGAGRIGWIKKGKSADVHKMANSGIRCNIISEKNGYAYYFGGPQGSEAYYVDGNTKFSNIWLDIYRREADLEKSVLATFKLKK